MKITIHDGSPLAHTIAIAKAEPCDDCTWVEVQAMCDLEPRLELGRACPEHGGRP